MLTSIAREALRHIGLTVSRAGAENRFDATAVVLRQMATCGYTPRTVIDVGANVGQWSAVASRIFPTATFHLLEPQPACHAALARFDGPRFVRHAIAATAPGRAEVQMTGTGDGTSSGAYVTVASEPSDTAYPAVTLDDLFGERIQRNDRALLKLDIEAHELDALAGARRLLTVVEAVFCEVRFFDVHGSGRPVFADVLQFLREHGFELYDVAALSGRARDGRLRLGDVIFVRRDSPLVADRDT